MSELPDDAIGIYHRMFDFSGVRIPFSSFLLTLIKHYRVYFSQLGPLGLNKVITFEVLCRSLQIEPTVALFRVFQTLCKHGDWFSFAKRRAPSPVCIDDNRSCMKHWKIDFFLIDRRAILDFMVWRHLSAAIDDPRPVVGSFNMADFRRLSAHVIKLRDMPEGVLVLSGLSRVWKIRVCDPVLRGANGNVTGIHDFLCLPEWTGSEVQEEPHHDIRPTLQRLPFYCTPPAAADAVIPDPTLEDLVVGTPSVKILAKAEASQKRKASTFGATSSHVAKRTRSALAQSSGSTTRPSLFVGNSDDESDDDDACVEISLVTLIRSAAVIPSSGNQCGSSTAPTAEDSRGKGIMVDVAAAPPVGVSRPRPSSSPSPSFRDVSGDAIHTDHFSFSVGPYYAAYPEGGVAGNCEFTCEEWDAPYRLTFGVDGVFSTWMAFGGNTRDLGSFGEEMDMTTTLHQILEEVVHTERGDGVASFKRWRQDIEKIISLASEVLDIVLVITPSYELGFRRFNSPRDRNEKIYNYAKNDAAMASGFLATASGLPT
ncbi:hypothetical protein Tco_0260824 [Tanacetum coccineum]